MNCSDIVIEIENPVMRDLLRDGLLKKGFEEFKHHGYNSCHFITLYEDNQFQDLNFRPPGKFHKIESVEDWLFLILTA